MRVKSRLLRLFVVPAVLAAVTTAGVVVMPGVAGAANPPTIISITPNIAPPGFNFVDIHGTHLTPGGNAPTVIFGGTGGSTGNPPSTPPTNGCAATVNSWNDHDVLVIPPPNAPGCPALSTVNVWIMTTQGSFLDVGAFTYGVLPATKLVFTNNPTNTVAGVNIVGTPDGTHGVQVSVENASNVVDTTDNTTIICVSLTGANPPPLNGTLCQTAVAGVATFPDLNIDVAGTGYQLSATSTNNNALTDALSSLFNITAAAADHLAFTTQPADSTAGANINGPPTVTVQDH
jgi:hypothetical protein